MRHGMTSQGRPSLGFAYLLLWTGSVQHSEPKDEADKLKASFIYARAHPKHTSAFGAEMCGVGGPISDASGGEWTHCSLYSYSFCAAVQLWWVQRSGKWTHDACDMW